MYTYGSTFLSKSAARDPKVKSDDPTSTGFPPVSVNKLVIAAESVETSIHHPIFWVVAGACALP